VVAVNPKLSAKNMRELIAEAKATSSKLNYATSGIGSMPHFATVVFSVFAGVDMVHVPYKSGGLAVTSVVAGDTHLTFATSPSVMPQVNAGRLRGLAVTTRQKSPLVPTLPGMADSGLANYDVSIWYGLFLPAGTPRPVVMRLFEAAGKSLPDPKFQEMMAKDGTETPASKSPEEFAAFIREETRLTAKVIKESGAKFE
jgi:tripartite-type tricarboxylate transporter receptor subunit TctC